MRANPCECADPGCPVCHGNCAENACDTLYRIDMLDATGTRFCERCGDDAFTSGLFTDSTSSEDM